MKKYYIIFTLAVIAIITLQSLYIKSLYNNYINSESNYINERIYEAIDLEQHYRWVVKDQENVSFIANFTDLDDMSQKMLDSILAISPLPPKPITRSYDIRELLRNGVIRNSDEIESLERQDKYYEDGYPININILDSLLDVQIGKGYLNRIEIRNSADSLLSETGDKIDYNYASRRIQQGFKGYQFITVFAQIEPSKFIKDTIWVLILSLMIISLPLISLLYLLTGIRRKRAALFIREQSVNGLIHDLKSPLSSVATMLSLFKVSETNPQKKELLEMNFRSVSYLIEKIETLLEVCRYRKANVIVSKIPLQGSKLESRIEQIKDTLLLGFQDKKVCSVNINSCINSDKDIFVDILHFDTIITTLLDNALKYSNKVVNIDITLEISRDNNLIIKVEDDGFGIEKRYIKRIFNQFFRIPNLGIKGFGIGLSYIRLIAQAHNGSISVESVIGKGSRFEVKLNCKKDE